MSKETPYDIFNRLIITPMIDSGQELTNLFPDSILFGSLLLYIVTQNVSLGVLSIFCLETSLMHKIVAFIYEAAAGPDANPPISGKSNEEIARCLSGFKSGRREWERILSANKAPTVSIFFWGSFVAYISGANYSFAQVLTTMGQNWWPRIIFSIVGISLLTLLFILGRVGGSCDTWGSIAFALLTGLGCGFLFYFINLNLFGLEGLNFNGLPNLVNKTDQGSPVYVCAPPSN
jgi:hypothetical protein